MEDTLNILIEITDDLTENLYNYRNLKIKFNEYDDEDLFRFFQINLKMRHDLFHYLVLNSLGFCWQEEKKIGDFFPNISFANLTPDIFIKIDDCYVIIDVSITIDKYKTEKNKFDKYMPLCEKIKEMGFESVYIHLNLSKLSDVYVEIKKIEKYMIKEFDFNAYNEIFEIYNENRNFINRYISSEYINKVINFKEYEENLKGKIKDTDIDEADLNNCIKRYPEIDDYDYFNNLDEDDFVLYLRNILNDKSSEIYNKYKDEVNSKKQYTEAFQDISAENENEKKFDIKGPSPTHHFLLQHYEETDLMPCLKGKSSEQEMILNFMNFISNSSCSSGSDYKYHFIKELFQYTIEALKIPMNNNMFMRGYFMSEEEDMKMKKEFFNLKESKKIEGGFREFVISKKNNNNIKLKNDHCCKQKKSIKLKGDLNMDFRKNIEEAGVGKKKDREYATKFTTISEENKIYVDNMIDYLKTPIERTYREEEWLNCDSGVDDEMAQKLKNISKEEYLPFYNNFKNTVCYNYMKTAHFFAQELMHIQLFNNKSQRKEFHFFNCGQSNVLYIMMNSYAEGLKDMGKPYMCVVITKKPDFYSPFFGKTTKLPLDDGYHLVISNWMRLPSFKIIHMRDSFYSVLSSTMNSIMSLYKRGDKSLLNQKYNKIYALRAIISLATNQKIGEYLMNVRYAYMSSFSSYTNIFELLKDKFSPPYKNCLIIWIIMKLKENLPTIFEEVVLKEKIKFVKPRYDNDKRRIESIGGDIDLKSLWGDYRLNDVNEILDEAFLYVHTIKEPSDIYREQVKAIQTIIKFQTEFDNLNEKVKKGKISTHKEFDDFLMNDSSIGCCGKIIFKSTQNYLNKLNIDYSVVVNDVLKENISEIISTKAVIHDIERKLVEFKETTTDKEIKMRIFDKYKQEIDDDKDHMKMRLVTNAQYYNNYKSRQKVFETILNIVENNEKIKTVHDLAKQCIEKNNDTLADICIKSQYGSKREFYVVDIESKALARLCENFFKMVCSKTEHEMISVPGDKKMLKMQKILDNSFKNNLDNKKIRFVNGDCTKWSAAETMASFTSMTMAFKERLPPKFYKMLQCTFAKWATKEIQVPTEVMNKTFALTEETKYLNDEYTKKTGKIKSTQNFLQGMFNYSSSFKAVCCNDYTYTLWRKIYPNSTLEVNHMEHSDDYALIIIYENEEEFVKFRTLQKMMMKFHGYNDSVRKTSCQNVFMEFVSLMSFNGVMLYPQIKKTKEVNLNLPCTGYRQDIDSALSRVGECMRMGCNQSFLYFFQKLHVYCVAEAYSLLPSMRNNRGENYHDLMKKPCEIYGLPDCLPLFSLYCKGNVNNYRLFHYGENNVKSLLLQMYLYALDTNDNSDFDVNDQYATSLMNLNFSYSKDNKVLDKIKSNLNWSYDEAEKFWKEHCSYRFIKPHDTDNLIKWTKSMFYNKIFTEAYSYLNRVQMTMRLSRYVSKEVVSFKNKDLKEEIRSNLSYTILDSMRKIDEKLFMYKIKADEIVKNPDIEKNNLNSFLRIITKNDPTYSAIYSLLKYLKIEKSHFKKRNIQIATLTPNKITTFHIVNEPGAIIQYLHNKEDFEKDNRNIISIESLLRDIEILEKRLKNVLKSDKPIDILTVYNEIILSKARPIPMIGFDKESRLLDDNIKNILINNYFVETTAEVFFKGITEVRDTTTNEIVYKKSIFKSTDYNRMNLENIALIYSFLKIILNKSNTEIREILSSYEFLTDEEENKYTDYKGVLDIYNNNYIKQGKLFITELKTCAYLKAALMNDYTAIEYYTSKYYTYYCDYIEKGIYEHSNKTYKGITRVHIKYGDQNFNVYQKNSETPILICSTQNINKLKVIYNMALKTCYRMEEDKFKDEFFKDNLNNYKIDYNNFKFEKDMMLNGYKIKEILVKTKMNYLVFMSVNRIHIENPDCVYPIFRTYEFIKDRQANKNKHYIWTTRINDDNLSVYSGRSKIIVLPFWRCRQSLSIKLNSNCENKKLFNGINLTTIITNNFISNYYNRKYNYLKFDNFDYNDLDENEIDIELSYKYYYNFFKKIYFNSNNNFDDMLLTKENLIFDSENEDNHDNDMGNLINDDDDENIVVGGFLNEDNHDPDLDEIYTSYNINTDYLINSFDLILPNQKNSNVKNKKPVYEVDDKINYIIKTLKSQNFKIIVWLSNFFHKINETMSMKTSICLIEFFKKSCYNTNAHIKLAILYCCNHKLLEYRNKNSKYAIIPIKNCGEDDFGFYVKKIVKNPGEDIEKISHNYTVEAIENTNNYFVYVECEFERFKAMIDTELAEIEKINNDISIRKNIFNTMIKSIYENDFETFQMENNSMSEKDIMARLGMLI